MSNVKIPEISEEHREWLNALGFYKEEIHVLERRLTEVASRNTSFEARQGIEHFQNQFVVQKNNIDELRHRIHEHLDAMINYAAKHKWNVVDWQEGRHEALKTEFQSLEKVVNELRSEFNGFLSKWL